jgi:fucose permease
VSDAAPPGRTARASLALACLAFAGIGLPDGLLGVAWPSIRAGFAVSLDSLGVLLASTTTGYVVSSAAAGRLVSRTGVGVVLAASCAVTAASLLGTASAPLWWALAPLAALAGLGAGAIDAGLNAHVAAHHGARTLSWLHACYGVGAMAGPALMTRVLASGAPWQRGYAIVGAAQLALAAAFVASLRQWPPGAGAATPDAAAAAIPRRDALGALRLPAAWFGIALFLLYTGHEAATGAWSYSLLHLGRGMGMEGAGASVSAYWGALAAGRVLAVFVLAALPVERLLPGAIAAMVAADVLLVAALGPLADGAALVLLGVASGPVFPCLIATTARRVGGVRAAEVVGLQVAAAAIGQALVPWAAGAAAGRAGLGVLAPGLLGVALVLLALYGATVRVPKAAPRAARVARAAIQRR